MLACFIFLLTNIIKLPIKKYTSKFDENKRKSLNTVIILIPLGLSYLSCYLYAIITNSFSLNLTTSSLIVHFLSNFINEIIIRIVAIIKSIVSKKTIKQEDFDSIRETINTLVPIIPSNVYTKEKTLVELEDLESQKNKLLNSSPILDLDKLEIIEEKISKLKLTTKKHRTFL